MVFTKKNKAKLLLIEDYIKIILINNFFNNTSSLIKIENLNLIKKQIEILKLSYELIFKTNRFDNLSILILKKELKNNNSLYNLALSNELKAKQFISNSIKDISTSLTNNLNIIKKGKVNFPLYLL